MLSFGSYKVCGLLQGFLYSVYEWGSFHSSGRHFSFYVTVDHIFFKMSLISCLFVVVFLDNS